MTHHSQEDEEKSDDFPIEKHFLCEYCGRSYLQWNNLSKYICVALYYKQSNF